MPLYDPAPAPRRSHGKRASELWEHWRGLAAELGLDAGQRRDLRVVGLPEAEAWHLYDAATCQRVLDELVGLARRRRPLVRLGRNSHGLPVLVVDPQGRDTDYEAVVRLFLERANEAQRQAVLADLEAQRGSITGERVAARWSLSARTLYRWVQEQRRQVLVVGSAIPTPPVAAPPRTKPLADCHSDPSGGSPGASIG